MGDIMRIVLAMAALMLGMGVAVAQSPGAGGSAADALNARMLQASDKCYALAGAERDACCRQYFNNLCGPPEAIPTAATSAAAPVSIPAAAASRPPTPAAGPAPARVVVSTGDGTADVLNGFVLKEMAQCRAQATTARRACCERLLHPNACAE